MTHDIPVAFLATSENHLAFKKFFAMLKDSNYPLQVVVCDDRVAIKAALNEVYPKAKIQLCQNHYLENFRRILHIRTDPTYHKFFASLQKRLFQNLCDDQIVTQQLRLLMARYGQTDKLCRAIIMEIHDRREVLFQYLNFPNCPKDTNLIELYNSHLQSRLKSIKGFQSFNTAKRWLNGYIIRRRTKSLTDCDIKFKKLNGYPSLFWTIKDGLDRKSVV